MKSKKFWIPLIAFVLICLSVEVVGSLWTREAVSSWYSTLAKPSWTPPDSVFGPVWSVLYIMIAIAGTLFYRAKPSHKRSVVLLFYGLQLGLNFIWSFLFFALRSPILGLIDIALLCLCIIVTMVKGWGVRPLGTIFLLPYLLWVIYATALNAGIYFLMSKAA